MPDEPKTNPIPTLGEVFEPGRVRASAPAAGATSDEARGPKRADETPPRAPRSAFEVRLEAMIGEILKRHMEAAREEIMRTVHEAVRGRRSPG